MAELELNSISPPTPPGAPPPDDSTKPFVDEIAVAWRNFFQPVYNGLLQPNDDTLATRGRGKGLRIYDELERDGHCYSVISKRKMALIAREWNIEPASPRKADKMAADIVQQQLDALPFDLICIDLLDAILKGYAVAELMWETGSQISISRAIAREQRRFVFDARYQLRLLTLEDPVFGIALPERKFVVHSFGAKDANPYGLGLGSKLFWPVFFKRQGLQFWMTLLDKYGSPTAIGTYPAGANANAKSTLLAALQAISQEAQIAVPVGMDVKLLEATRGGNAGYEQFLRYLDDEMSKTVLGETMSTTSHSSGMGSSQANVHNQVRMEIVKADADLLASTLNQTLIKWIAAYNRPDASPPRIWWDVSEGVNLLQAAQTDQIIASIGFEPTIEYIREKYGEGWNPAPKPKPAPGLDGGAPPQPGDGTGAESVQFADAPAADRADAQSARLAQQLDPSLKAWIGAVKKIVDQAGSLEDLRDRITDAWPKMTVTETAKTMQAAFAAAQLAGRYDLLKGIGPA